MPEVLVEPRAPHRADGISGLEHGPHARAGAAANEAEMPAVLASHQLRDRVRLAVPPPAEHDAAVGPFHAPDPPRTRFSYPGTPVPSPDNARDRRPSPRAPSRRGRDAPAPRSPRRFRGALLRRSP